MKRLLFACASMVLASVAVSSFGERAVAQTKSPPIPGLSGVQKVPQQTYLPTSPPLVGKGGVPPFAGSRNIPEEWQQAQEDLSINRDIFVTAKEGPWMIYVMSYKGPKAPSMARELAMELKNSYKLPAFVFNYGEKEHREELARRQKITEERMQQLRRAGLPPDVPIRVPHMRVDVEVGVLIGGYPNNDAARRELKRIRELKPLDPKRVKLDTQVRIDPKANRPEVVGVVNPFLQAFVARNPSIEQQQNHANEVADIATLRRLNASENLSLLKSPKPFTLAVKIFPLPTTIEQKSSGGILGAMGFGGKGGTTGERVDIAFHNAHSLAEVLRMGNWEAYVLHTKYYSLVTVGAYDHPEDPRIGHDRQALTNVSAKLASRSQQLQLDAGFPLMAVPK